jgi:photosystem II stability/assembly factor-like uncharacterized protein
MKPLFRLLGIVFLLFVASVSSDGQATFEPLNGPTGVRSINNIVSDNTGKLFMSKDYKIYTSVDNGDNWSLCMNGAPQDYNYNFIKNPIGEVFMKVTTYYVSLYSYKSSSNSWELKASGYESYDFDTQGNLWATKNESFNQIYISSNGGASFQQIPLNGEANGWLDKLETFNEDHNLIAASYGSSQKIFHFNRNGEVLLVIEGSPINFLGYNPITGTAFQSDSEMNRRSTDGGLTWQEMVFDPNSTFPGSIGNIYFKSNGSIWLRAGSEFYVSYDDGVNWVKNAYTTNWYDNVFYTNQDTWFQNNQCSFPEFGRTTDNGTTWTDLSVNFKEPSVLDIKKDTNGNLYAATCSNNAYEISIDDGVTWSDYHISNNNNLFVRSIAIRSDGVRLAIDSDGKLHRSVDDGINWIEMPDIDIFSYVNKRVFLDKQNNFLIFSDFNTYKSIDGGLNWSPLNIFVFDDGMPYFHPNGDMFMIDYTSLTYYSASQDTFFFIEQTFDPNAWYTYGATACSQSGTLFMNGNDFSVGNKLFRIPDILGTWESIPFFEDKLIGLITINSVGHVFVSTDSSIYRSNDDGFSWEFYAQLPNIYPLVMTCSPDNYLYLGYSGDVVHRSFSPTTEAHYILGDSWLDLNNDCQKDPTENPLPYTKIKANGSDDYIGFVRPDGSYLVNAPAGTYQLNIVPPNPLYAPCNADATVLLDATHDSVIVDMPLRVVAFCPYLSVNLSTPFLRRCFENTYTIHYKNEGTAVAQNAYIEVTLDSLFEFISASLPVFSQNGLVYTFQVGNLDINQSGSFWLKTKVSCLAELGQTHCISANIFPDAPCGTPLVNRTNTQECRENIGSFDPNDKRAFVDGKENPSNILQNTEIEYFIRFQNTGTDTAFRVVVEDRISGLLDLSTLTPLVSSHPFSIEVKDQRTIRFVFNNIMLPDSNINEAASHGFIKFRINQMPDLQNGEVIANLADIFFDFNAPVRTNTSSMIVGITNTYTPSADYQVSAYPNPFNDQISFEINTKQPLNSRMTLSIVDVLGKQILREEFLGNNHNLLVSDWQNGIYFYKIENGDGVIGAGKLMKM